MIAVSVRGLTKSFGIHTVLKNVDLTLREGERIGLVGVNGSGKSTLMRILAGLDTGDGGEVSVARGIRIGYLAQQDMLEQGSTLWDELEKLYQPTFEMEKRLRALEAEMAVAHEDAALFESLSTEYDRLTKRFEEADGYSWQSMITGVLNGLGFLPEQYHRSVDSLSGGEKTRLSLARLLLQKPELLLLDEPTNHLDMDTLQWLENTLTAYRGSVLVISHDRYFLDHVCTGIAELLGGVLEQYAGNYTQYVSRRQERFETRLRAYNLQQKEIERQQAIIARYRMFNREKSIKAAESREKALERMDRLEKPEEDRSIRLSFQAGARTGQDVLIAENLSKRYDDKQLFRDLSLHIRSGERIAVIGPNGIGKTTLLRILIGEETPDAGSVRLGSNVTIGYYDQQQARLDERKTVLDEVWDRFPRMEQSDVRGALGMFLFTGDDVYQPIRTLSGGEKGRVALTTLMLQHDNFLVLDEPTNHLDMDSREALEDALSGFGGTILTVSHDRYFINRIADRIVEITPESVQSYLGNYDDYFEKKHRPQESEAAIGKTRTLLEKEKRREKQGREALRQLKLRAQQAEKAVAEAEAKISRLEDRLADPALYNDPGKAQETTRQYQAAQDRLAELYEAWETAEAELDTTT